MTPLVKMREHSPNFPVEFFIFCFAFSDFPHLGRIRPGRVGVAAVGPARAVVAAPAGGGVVELGARPVVTELPGVRDKHIQGDHSGCSQPPIDIKTKAEF